jgi:hypothetical protein
LLLQPLPVKTYVFDERLVPGVNQVEITISRADEVRVVKLKPAIIFGTQIMLYPFDYTIHAGSIRVIQLVPF